MSVEVATWVPLLTSSLIETELLLRARANSMMSVTEIDNVSCVELVPSLAVMVSEYDVVVS